MKEFDIVLLTEERYDKPVLITDYIRNILLDDEILTAALNAVGLKVIRKNWADPDFDWASAEFAFFRTTWNYFNHFDKFQNWLNITSGQTKFVNTINTIRWNMDKHYLADLKNNNIHVVETYFIEKNDPRTLTEISGQFKTEFLILKPAVSGAARQTYKLSSDTILQHEEIYKSLIANESMLLQPFQQNIIEQGEVAMMVIGGKFTHAVLKKAKQGDFRVQDDFGGTLHAYQPSLEEIEFAESAVRACDPQPVYGRVDIIRDNQDKLAIMELELIEPELWLRRNPSAADLLASEILKLF